MRPACPPPAANWAQISGVKLQNTVKQSSSLWTGRWGHASTVYTGLDGHDVLVVMGGDSYSSETGTGTLNNDVWITNNLCASRA